MTIPRQASRRIDAAQAARLLQAHRKGTGPAVEVLDVRDPAHYTAAHVPDAAHLDQANFSQTLRRLARDVTLLIYCYHGNASQGWAEAFADFGFAHPLSVDGGYAALAAALAEPGTSPTAPGDDAGAALGEFLAANGFDPEDLNAPRVHGLTPLMRAALAGRPALVAELLARGADPQVRNDDGNNALWLACVADSGDAVRRLVAAGIDIDNRNLVGATVLMYCASAGKPAMLRLLLALGADPLLTNQDGARAVDLAATRACLAPLRHTIRRLDEELTS